MINFIRNLIAAPLRIVFWICGFFHAVNRLTLARIIWNITGDVADGSNAIILTANSEGMDSACKVALKVLEETLDASAALMMGQLEVHARCDVRAAFDWIKKAKQMNCKNTESLLKLELMIGDTVDQIDTEQVVEQILARNDLPGDYTKAALVTRAELFLKEKKWDAAEKIADRILLIEEYPYARMIKWVVATASGNNDQAQMNFEKIGNNVTPTDLYINLALGWYYLGRMDKAKEQLAQCIKNGMNPNLLVIINPGFKELLLEMQNDFYKEAQ